MNRIGFDGTEGEIIPAQDAGALTQQFQQLNPTHPKAFFFGIEKLDKLLNQPDVVGLRIYYAEKGYHPVTQDLVVVGVDAQGNDVLQEVLSHGVASPMYGGNLNMLNHD